MSTIVITGASSGIGRAAAIALAAQGHELGIVGRDPQRTHEVAERTGGTPFLVDFSSIASVRRLAGELADRYPHIDALANNAGGVHRKRIITDDGFELTWQSNVLAPFVLTTALIERLEGGRVIFTSSAASFTAAVHFGNPNHAGLPWLRGYGPYGAAKRADAMLAAEVPRRTGVDAYAFHPGIVATRFSGWDRGPIAPIMSRIAESPEQGAAPLVHLASAEDLGVPPGTYFDQLKPGGRLPRQATDPVAQANLWTLLERQAASVA